MELSPATKQWTTIHSISIAEVAMIAHPARLFEGLFRHKDAVARHLKAPMLCEREAYLVQLAESGYSRRFLTDRAWMLCHVARLLRPADDGNVSEATVSSAATRWLAEGALQPWHGKRAKDSQFKAVARSWYKFLGRYERPGLSAGHFASPLFEFKLTLRNELSYLESSIGSCASSVKCFLIWISSRRDNLKAICLEDLDAFFAERRANGSSHRTIIAHARSLRVFFRFAERRGWSANAFSRSIETPALRQAHREIICPSWRSVRRVLRSLDDSNASQCRAKAVLLLACVYGLRRSEISRLTLEDLDWQTEVLTVRRSKRGRIQQFPLQREVGDAVLRYLRTVRPPSKFREIFLTMHFPHRPAVNIGSAMRKILTATNRCDPSAGLHSLRHACATELLRKGTSLKGIADFLGHRSLDSVSNYAHCSPDALRAVAAFSLAQVL